MTGLGTNGPADDVVEDVGVGTDELLSLGFTGTKIHKLNLYVPQNLLIGNLHLLKRQKQREVAMTG